MNNSFETPEPVVINNNTTIAYCPRCGMNLEDYHLIGVCPNCYQYLMWTDKRRKVKDSTELSGGHLW